MRILFLAPRVCWPLNTGAKLRNYHLSRVLAERASVTFIAFSENGVPSGNGPNFYDRTISVPRDPGYTYLNILRGGLGSTPLPVLNYTSERMKQALSQTFGEQGFDIVQIESVHLIPYLPIIRAARNPPLVVCDWHNIESELMRRYSERGANGLRKTYARATARKMDALERRAIREFDAHITVSNRDSDRLREQDSGTQVYVIENGVDAAYYCDEQLDLAHAGWEADGKPSSAQLSKSISNLARHRVVFVGSMDYHANIDAVVTFAHEVWPSVRERNPELIFTIVGRDPIREVRELASLPGVEVTGTVNDVRPYYREAVAAVVPLRVGGGSRLKITEAMAAGVPVISTVLGAEGLDVRHGENILIADGTGELKEAIVNVAANDEVRQKLRAGGRTLVNNRYDWAQLGASLAQIHEGLLKSNGSQQFSRAHKHRKQTTESTIKLLALVEATTINAVAKNVLDFHRTSLELRRGSGNFPLVEISLVTFQRARQTDGAQDDNQFVTAARQLGLVIDVIAENGRFDRKVIPALKEIVKRRAPDIVLTHSVKSHFLLWRSQLWSQFPWIAFHHGYTTTDRKMRLYNQLDRWSLPKADKVITVCEAFARDLSETKGIPRDRILVQHNSINPEPRARAEDVRALKTRFGITDDERVILAVGRLSREKAHVDLLRAFKELLETHPDLGTRLIIVGGGPERKRLELVAKSLGISEQVIFVGQVSDVQPYYAIADVLANASHSEGSPYVLLEAMAAGLPIVATMVGGVPEMLKDEFSGLLVPPRDHQTMAAAIARVLTDAKLAKSLTANASAQIGTRFSTEIYVRSLVEIYLDVSRSTSK